MKRVSGPRADLYQTGYGRSLEPPANSSPRRPWLAARTRVAWLASPLLNFAGELSLPLQSPLLAVSQLTETQRAACSQPKSDSQSLKWTRPSPWLSPLTHFLSTYSSTLNPPLNSVLSPIYLCSNPTHAFASFLARIRTHFLSKWVHYSPIHDMYLLSPNPRISHIGGQDCNKGGTAWLASSSAAQGSEGDSSQQAVVL